MQVRNPKLAFAEALPHWAPNREFCQITNAGSTSQSTYLGPFLTSASTTTDRWQRREWWQRRKWRWVWRSLSPFTGPIRPSISTT